MRNRRAGVWTVQSFFKEIADILGRTVEDVRYKSKRGELSGRANGVKFKVVDIGAEEPVARVGGEEYLDPDAAARAVERQMKTSRRLCAECRRKKAKSLYPDLAEKVVEKAKDTLEFTSQDDPNWLNLAVDASADMNFKEQIQYLRESPNWDAALEIREVTSWSETFDEAVGWLSAKALREDAKQMLIEEGYNPV